MSETFIKPVQSGLILDNPLLHWEHNSVAGVMEIKQALLSKDWFLYLCPNPETQYSVYFDTLACVSFSACRVFKALMNLYLDSSLIPDDTVAWLEFIGFIVDGKFECSDRFVAKMSGTSRDGNTAGAVAEAIREYGMVPESAWPYPRSQRQPVFNWDDYYVEIPDSVRNIAREFNRRISMNYYAVTKENFNDALAYSPLQVFGFAWARNAQGKYYTPNGQSMNHAFVLGAPDKRIFDTYEPDFIKQLDPAYDLYWAGYRYALTFINLNIPMKLIKPRGSNTVFLVDELDKKRPFFDEAHFNSIAPALGLAKSKSQNGGFTDWSQVKEVSAEEAAQYPADRAIVTMQ